MKLLNCRTALAVVCALMISPGETLLRAQQPSTPANLQPEQLDSLVAPIALYPDPLLAQVLAASTYPLQIVEASRWLQQNSSLKGPDLIKAESRRSS